MNFANLAMRNLSRQKRRSILLGSAIAFGILFITLINGFTGSFVTNVGENFSHLLAGHIFLEGVEKSDSGRDLYVIRDDKEIVQVIEDMNIPYLYLTKRTTFDGFLIFEGKTVRQSIIGVDWASEKYFKERLILQEGEFEAMDDPKGIIISTKIAERLNVSLGDQILVKLKTYTGQQNVGEFNVRAISIDTGLFGAISCYAGMDYVNELMNLQPDEYMTLGIYLEELTDTDPYAQILFPALKEHIELFDRDQKNADGEDQNPFLSILQQQDEEEWSGVRYRFTTINDILSEVEEIVRILNIAGLIIMLVLFSIVMVGITNTFRMVMFERIQEIGTMRAVGMQQSEVRSLFLFEALFLAIIGVIAGLALAGLVMFIVSRIYWGVDTPLFMLLKNGYMTFKVTPLQMLINISIVMALTLGAAFMPAQKAARLEPADALRTEK